MDIKMDTEDENVLFLPYSEIVTNNVNGKEFFLPIIENVVIRLNQLSRQCGSNFTSICPYHRFGHCRTMSGVAIMTKGLRYENEKDFVIKYNQYKHLFGEDNDPIRGYLVYIFTDNNVCEIYDVCSSRSSRRGGYMKKIFLTLFEKIRNSEIKTIWLGVDFKNPYFEQAIGLYTSVGFKYPMFNNSTLDGFKPGLNFIELTYKLDESNILSSEDRQKIIETSLLIRNNELAIYNSCSLNIHVHKKITDSLKLLLKIDTEVAGFFTIRTSDTLNNTVYYNIDYNPTLISNGEYGNVETPIKIKEITNPSIKNNCYFNFHTHPSICYIKEKCLVGWPSGQDMLTVIHIYMYHNILKHYVVTMEGIYSIGITIEFKYFLKLMNIVLDSACTNNFLNIIKSMFDFSEKFRTTSSILNEHGIINEFTGLFNINNYLLHTRNVSMRDVKYSSLNTPETSMAIDKCLSDKIRPEYLEGIKLFNIDAFTWEHIDQHNGFLDHIDFQSSNICGDFILDMTKQGDHMYGKDTINTIVYR